MRKEKYVPIACVVMAVAIFSGCGQSGNSLHNQSSAVAVSEAAQTSSGSSVVASSGSAGAVSAPVSASSEQAVAPEKNPPGDIPDTQIFVKYVSSLGGYELQVPEGWARTENGANVNFVDKFDGVKVEISKSSYPLSVDSINQNYLPALKKVGRAIAVASIKEAKLKGGTAIVLSYSSNSDPDPLTDKQIRLEDTSYFFENNGKMAVLTVWAPYGADNVDQWNLMSNSFQWK